MFVLYYEGEDEIQKKYFSGNNNRLNVVTGGFFKLTCGISRVFYEDVRLDHYFHQAKQGK